MNNKQSSVEWFALWVCNNTVCKPEDVKKAFQQAKAMHKEEYKNAFKGGIYWDTDLLPIDPNKYDEDAEQYYNETFNNGKETEQR